MGHRYLEIVDVRSKWLDAHIIQTYQVSRIRRESHAFECHLTLTRMLPCILDKFHAFQ